VVVQVGEREAGAVVEEPRAARIRLRQAPPHPRRGSRDSGGGGARHQGGVRSSSEGHAQPGPGGESGRAIGGTDMGDTGGCLPSLRREAMPTSAGAGWQDVPG
jgi:hypothetical protein